MKKNLTTSYQLLATKSWLRSIAVIRDAPTVIPDLIRDLRNKNKPHHKPRAFLKKHLKLPFRPPVKGGPRGVWSFALMFLALTVIGFGALRLFQTTETQAWYHDNWAHRKILTIDADQVSGSSNLENFPVLVSLTSDSNLNDNAQADGDDILFTDKTGTKLDHEIESYSSGTLTAWVRIPSLSPTNDTELHMYYGNPQTTDQSNATGVWNDDYAGVWHLNQSGDGTADEFTDSTTNANHGQGGLGTSSAVPTQTSSGKIGAALDFDGSDDFINTGSGSSLDDLSQMTLSIWLYSDDNDNNRYIMTKVAGGGERWAFYNTNAGTGRGYFLVGYSGADIDLERSTADGFITQGTWNHLVLTWDGSQTASNAKMYKNGIEVSYAGSTNATGTRGSDAAGPMEIGRYVGGGGNNYIYGLLDEARVLNTVKSTDWITTEYNNQNSPSTFFSTGHQETRTRGPLAYWALDEGYGTTANDSTGNGNTGTISGATWKTSEFCVTGNCLQFDGSDDYLSIGDNNDFNLSTASISTWFKLNSYNTEHQMLWDKNQSGDNSGDIAFFISESDHSTDPNKLTLMVDDGTGSAYIYSDQSIALNTWYHATAVLGSNGMKMYLNGLIQSDTNARTTGMQNTSTTATIGAGDPTYQYFNGFIDEVQIYPYARTADQIKQDYIGGGVALGSSPPDKGGAGGLSHGLIGYWTMEDNVSGTSQTITDHSGNGNNGTTSSANGTGMDCTTGGKFGYGCDFDGTDDYIDVGDQDSYDFDATQEFSVSVWMKNSTGDGYYGLVTKRHDVNSPHEGWSLQQRVTTSLLQFEISDGTTEAGTAGSNYVDGNWHHVVGTLNRSTQTLTLYVDGQEIDSASTTNVGSIASTRKLMIGAFNGGNDNWPGLLDQVRIYNRALSASEVQALYQYAPGPVAYYDFNEGTGTGVNAIKDKSGNNYHLTTYNGITESNWSTGKFGKSLQFNSADKNKVCYDTNSDGDCDAAEAGPSALQIVGNLTLGAWIYIDDLDINRHIIQQGYLGTIDSVNNFLYEVVVDNGGDIVYKHQYDTNSNQTNTFDTNLTTNQWKYFSLVRDISANTVKVFIDGIQTGSTYTYTTDPNGGTSGMFMVGSYRNGTSGNTWDQWDGRLDEIKVYNYPRTQEQILEDMNAGHPAVGTPVGSTVLHLSMDEGYGTTANDKSPQNNDGTVSGATWTNDGKFGKALFFDSTADYITVADDDTLSFTDGSDQDLSFSVSMWVNPNNVNESYLLEKRVSNTYEYSLYAGGGGVLRFIVHSGGASTITTAVETTDALSTDTWSHIIATYDGSEDYTGMKIFINGSDVEVQDWSNTHSSYAGMDNTAGDLYIGARSDFSEQYRYRGLIDELKIYPFALSSNQVKTEYNQGKQTVLGSTGTDSSGNPDNSSSRAYCIPGDTTTCNPPVLELNMEEKSGTIANDTSGNGNTGTLTSGPVWKSSVYCHQGNCLEFDGDDSNINAGSGSTIDDFYDSGGTLSAWIFPQSGGEGSLAHIYNKNRNVANLSSISGNQAKITVTQYFTSSINSWQTTDTVVTFNEWNHVTFIYDNSLTTNDPQIYVNGQEVPMSDIFINGSGARTSDASYNLHIGSSDSGGSAFDGLIDQVRVYDYARTPAQVAWDYNQGAPIAHYRFDECSGTTAYNSALSGNGDPVGFHGTITPGVGTAPDNSAAGTCNSGNNYEMWNDGTTGKWSSSLGFDGSDDYVDLGAQTDFEFGSNSFSLAAWIRPQAYNGGYAIFYGDTDDQWYGLQVGDANNFVFHVDDDVNKSQTTITNLLTDTWYHVVAVRDTSSTQIKLYLNGKLNSQATDITGSTNNATYRNTYLGRKTAIGVAAEHLNAQLDDVRIYNYALTAEQIKLIHNNGAINFQ